LTRGSIKGVDARHKTRHDDEGASLLSWRAGERRRMRGGWVYIMTNRPNGTLYVGVTSDLARRAWEHREGVAEGFSKRYDLKRLVFAEHHEDIAAAIQREKNLKHWPHAWKIQLITAQNPDWDDLYNRLS
jgi:putative endonuclease